MIVMVSDADPLFSAYVIQTLHGTEFEARVYDDEGAILSALGVPAIVLVRAEALHDMGALPSRHLAIAVVDERVEHGVENALSAGAEDVIVTPLESGKLLARLRVAKHRLAQPSRRVATTRDALEQELDRNATGEFVVRASDIAGSIHLLEGEISWASISTQPLRLADLLARAGVSVDSDTLAAVIEEARLTGQHFTDVLAQWGVVDAMTARACVQGYVSDTIAQLVADPQATTLFVPYPSTRASRLSFAPIDVMPAALAQSGIVPSPAVPRARRMPSPAPETIQAMTTAAELPGCIGVTMLDPATGSVIAATGVAVDERLAWSTMRAVGTLRRSISIEETEVVHIARAFQGQVVLIATFSLRQVSLGLARTSMNACQLWAA